MTIKNIKRRSVLKTLSVAGIAAATSTSISSGFNSFFVGFLIKLDFTASDAVDP